jgi:hypothetical protein
MPSEEILTSDVFKLRNGRMDWDQLQKFVGSKIHRYLHIYNYLGRYRSA